MNGWIDGLFSKQIIKKAFTYLSFYVLLVFALYLVLQNVGHTVRLPGVWPTLRFARLLDAMFLALPLLVLRKKVLVNIYLMSVCIYLLSVVMYFRGYHTLMPLSSYLMFYNLNGMADSYISYLRMKDLWGIILPFFLFCLLYHWGYKRVVHMRKKDIVGGCLCFLFVVISTACWYIPENNHIHIRPLYFFSSEEISAFRHYGFLNYWIYQIHTFQGVSEEERQQAVAFMEKNKDRTTGGNLIKPDAVGAKKNLIVLLVESMESWVVGCKVDEISVTPCLDSLMNSEKALFFSNVVPQVKDGRSSDAQLLLNTGLLPLNSGAAASLCYRNKFYTLADALKSKGYQSVSFICDFKDFWNQEATTRAYGFDALYDRLQGGEGRSNADEKLVRQGLQVLKDLPQPFYAQLVTISSHGPYEEPIIDSPLQHAHFKTDEQKYYAIAFQYVDRCIGQLISGLKKEGLYENSIVVITGDHDVRIPDIDEKRHDTLESHFFIPFIVFNSPFETDTSKVVGQVDLYPSLLDLMQVTDYTFTGLGQSVFGKSDDCALTHDFIPLGKGSTPDKIAKKRELWYISDILLRMDYFK